MLTFVNVCVVDMGEKEEKGWCVGLNTGHSARA